MRRATVTGMGEPKPAIPTVGLDGLQLGCLTRRGWAERLRADWLARRGARLPPLFMTSLNGNTLSLQARDPAFRKLIQQADGIDADGQSIVFASRILGQPLPERVATTDFFHDAAQIAEKEGMRFFLLGATEDENKAAQAAALRLYPGLQLSGRDGYFSREQEPAVISEIIAFGTDVLWVGLGVPREQDFVVRNRNALAGLTWVKTCGGLFNFLSGSSSRAPKWMQNLGFEWLYRLAREPRRLFTRYLVTNSHSLAILARECFALQRGKRA